MQALATKYRPTKFEDVCGQSSIIKILESQIAKKELKNCYLFCGASGCGKTTCARIFANRINDGVGTPIEIDGASNNGVDNVKQLVKTASERSLDGKYKVIIMDECHVLTSAAWQAFLKCIEEPPEFTIFIFCTTDPQKIPDTILNRVMRFNFTRISADKIKERLAYICEQEGITNYNDSIDYISRICHGGMRDSIALLDKASAYDKNLDISNVLTALGNYSYDTFFDLVNALIDGKETDVINIVTQFYNDGNDLRLFVDQFLRFCLDINKYALFRSVEVTQFPISCVDKLNQVTNFENPQNYYGYVVDKLLGLKNMMKNDSDVYSTIEVGLMKVARCQ